MKPMALHEISGQKPPTRKKLVPVKTKVAKRAVIPVAQNAVKWRA